MQIAPIADVKSKLSAYIENSKHTPVIVTKNGKPVAFIASIKGEKDLNFWLEIYEQHALPDSFDDSDTSLDAMIEEIRSLSRSKTSPIALAGLPLPAGQALESAKGVKINISEWIEIEKEMQQTQADDDEKTLLDIKHGLSH